MSDHKYEYLSRNARDALAEHIHEQAHQAVVAGSGGARGGKSETAREGETERAPTGRSDATLPDLPRPLPDAVSDEIANEGMRLADTAGDALRTGASTTQQLPQAAPSPPLSAEEEILRWREAEHALGQAYLRIRQLVPGAFDSPHAPTREQVWETTEAAVRALVAERERLLSAGLQASRHIDELRAALHRCGQHEGGICEHAHEWWKPEHAATCTCALRVLAEEEGTRGAAGNLWRYDGLLVA